MQCTNAGKKCVHLWHVGCHGKAAEVGFEPFCLHCGTTEGLKRVQLEMHMATPPSLHLSQLAPPAAQ